MLEGELTLLLDGGASHVLGRGAAARVAPGVRRQLVNRGGERLVLLALGGAEPHEGRDGVAYEDWDDAEGRPPAGRAAPGRTSARTRRARPRGPAAAAAPRRLAISRCPPPRSPTAAPAT